MWNSTLPSRFVDELPEDAVEVAEASATHSPGYGGGGSRFESMQPFGGSSYATPGWQRAQARASAGGNGGFSERGGGAYQSGFGTSSRGAGRRGSMLIEGELVAKSVGGSTFAVGGRVLHQKFGPGTVAVVDGNKLTVDFDKAGRKMVLDSFVDATA
jgi:DNA helicase-2/ATP-dependent DNA helicase PcrA